MRNTSKISNAGAVHGAFEAMEIFQLASGFRSSGEKLACSDGAVETIEGQILQAVLALGEVSKTGL
jgi:hypothetical protein